MWRKTESHPRHCRVLCSCVAAGIPVGSEVLHHLLGCWPFWEACQTFYRLLGSPANEANEAFLRSDRGMMKILVGTGWLGTGVQTISSCESCRSNDQSSVELSRFQTKRLVATQRCRTSEGAMAAMAMAAMGIQYPYSQHFPIKRGASWSYDLTFLTPG